MRETVRQRITTEFSCALLVFAPHGEIMYRSFNAIQLSASKLLFRTSIVVCFILSCASASWGQLTEGDVVLSEFFEELRRVDVASGSVDDILDSVPIGNIVGQNAEVLNSNTVILSSFSEL